MKILTQPERLPDWWWVDKTATCETCGTQLQLGKEDAQPRTHVEGWKFVTCPNCHHRAFLDKHISAAAITPRNGEG